ncbi:MAG: TspO/MBR family protein [Candidatus Moranbacteria bacterium]|nr:TspO/MBR family protein [Candidatus Moranbacteria bacterium]
MKSSLAFIFFVLLCEGVGITSALLAGPADSQWYLNLEKPFFNPPGWIFGPVWTLLYFLMGWAIYRIWKAESAQKEKIYLLFFAHLIFNFFWSIIFFRWQSINGAFLDIIILNLLIFYLILIMRRKDRLASILMLPYLAWTLFAAILNGFILFLN